MYFMYGYETFGRKVSAEKFTGLLSQLPAYIHTYILNSFFVVCTFMSRYETLYLGRHKTTACRKVNIDWFPNYICTYLGIKFVYLGVSFHNWV
jgi:choline-glycine betaine transporter